MGIVFLLLLLAQFEPEPRFGVSTLQETTAGVEPDIGPDNRIRLLESVVRSASHPTAQLRQSPVSLPHLTKVTLFRAEERLSYRRRSPVRCRRVGLHESPLFRATV
jgi:hypothetical protein